MTLVVNSPFQAELSTGADLSHAQLGWGQGGSWHCTLESLLPLLSLAGEKGGSPFLFVAGVAQTWEKVPEEQS